MNPHAITTANPLTGLKRLPIPARPATAPQAMVPGHPLTRKTGMVRREEASGATVLRAPAEASGNSGPRQLRDHEVFASLAQRSSDNRVRARRESKS